MLLGLVSSLEQNTRRNRRLVNVDTATPLIEHFHPCLLCRARKDAECESLPRVLFREEGYSPLFLNASEVKLISGFETPMQVTTSCGHDHNSLTSFSSVVVTKGHEQLIPFFGNNGESAWPFAPSFPLSPHYTFGSFLAIIRDDMSKQQFQTEVSQLLQL